MLRRLIPVPQVGPDTITAVACQDGLEAVAMMGLTRVPEEAI